MKPEGIHTPKQNNFKAVLNGLFVMKVEGGALFISLIVSVLIGIILVMFILIGRYNQQTITLFIQDAQLKQNLFSAFEIAQSDYFTEDQNGTWFKNVYNSDSIKITKALWGAYHLIRIETKNRHNSLFQCGLYGTNMSADTGLMISDNGRAISISGNVVFKSNCYLPKAGIRPAYIEGQSYVSVPGNQDYIKSSSRQIPDIRNELINGIKQQFNITNNNLDSVVYNISETCRQSFRKKTMVWEFGSGILSNKSLSENIKILAGEIEIDSSSNLNNVLIVCNKIHFKNGFRGKVHVIARDSIISEKRCEFNYPSSFVLFNENNLSQSFQYIEFKEDCVFSGGLLALNDLKNGRGVGKVFIKLNGKSEVNGFVYSSNFIHVEGNLNATVIGDKLLLKTPSAVYENHLLACEINPKKHAGLMAVPFVLKGRSEFICCEKLN